MNEQHGRFIRIYWECGEPAVYVRGHVTPREFRAEVERQGIDVARYGEPLHAYAHYAVTRHEDFDMLIQDHNEPGRGRFPVTRAEEVGTRTGR